MALSQSDIPWLRNLLQTALKNGASIRTILRAIEDALERGYRPRGHSQDTLDLSLLILRLGGRNLLTLHQHTSFVKIAPTVGCITQDIIQQNIGSVALTPRTQAGLKKLRGTALEEAAVFLSQSNSIGGLCWTHSPLVDVALNNYHSALNISHALTAGRVHLGKEVSVVGAHLFGEDMFYPILAAPTCKLENGDTTRRKAGHHTFVQISLSFTSPRYGTLSNLPGLNLLTGEYEITLDFDYKHVLKRFGTLLRSRNGMRLNNGRCINATMLQRYLMWIDGVDEAWALKLLYPDDPQDVPRAIELINAINSLADIDPTDQCVDTIADVDAIKILAGILRSLLRPFIDITLSLTEQVISLSCFAHLLYACYWDQQRLLMPNQLYYDSQTLFKNIIFCIAKQQTLDPTAPFTLQSSQWYVL
ncbi:hypothetical protein EV424DRAFT_1474664 [Suillus variegatus]|nr:hypothetical protein EV424DRAFT_1474664 [Suillus variegatus]